MQAVILAAGKSRRFYPLAEGTHKSMIKLLGKPIIEYTINGLVSSGIKEIIIVENNKGFISSYFGDGKRLNADIKYAVQEEPSGGGDGLLCAAPFVKDDFIFLNGSHADAENFIQKLINAKGDNKGVVLAREKEGTTNSGVLKVEKNKLIDLVEKPNKGEEPSKLCVIGIYLFSKTFLEELKNTPREHYSLEKAISSFAKKNPVWVVKTDIESVTLKYPWDLLGFKDFILKSVKTKVSKLADIAKSAQISREVIVEDGATIMEGAKIKGPCYIGKNAYIGTNSILRSGVDVGEKCVIGANMEFKNSIIMAGSKTHSGFIGDSIISQNCRVAAQFCTANVRLDRETVKVLIDDKKVDTGLRSLGMITGKNVHIGVKSSTMPGILIGHNVVVGPSTTVVRNIEENTTYYSKFQEIVATKKKKVVLFDIDYTLFDTKNFKDSNLKDHSLYNEVIGVLEKVSKVADLGIFSEGEVAFQKNKLVKTDIKKYFDKKHTHIVEKKDLSLEKILRKYEKDFLILVDDKLGVLHSAKNMMPSVFTVWVKRGMYAQLQKPIENFSPNETLDNLGELASIVSKV
ncbi:MAG: sugar phosphate nucleotidyltransferase [Candidatus Levybacteria bacterium]|nr:sugar phosphate nucleotidyltransferase [Candidatus Levybacteria bacterium]